MILRPFPLPRPVASSRRWGAFAAGLLLAMAAALASSAGANADSAPDADDFTDEERSHWAFQPVQRPPIPSVQAPGGVVTPIDALLLARLEPHGLSFSPPADRETFLRRATYDLTGIPPTPEEIADYLADDSPDADERVIDRLLASPHYGETWGRDWLDLVRFAETAGYNADPTRPLAWKFRDYVIRAFNADTPYDRFLGEQLAGDQLFPESQDALVATGYNRMWPDESNASNVLLARQDALNDMTSNVGAVFLGLSLGCAQCHDHKFDPLPQRDFYRLQAFFAGIVPRDRVVIGTRSSLDDYRARLERWLEESAPVRNELHEIEQGARARAGREKRMKFPPVVLESIDTPPEARTALQHQLVFWSERQIVLSEKDLVKQLSPEQESRRAELRKQLSALNARRPRPPAVADVMAAVDVPGEQPKTHLLAGGSYNHPEEELHAGFPSILRSASGTASGGDAAGASTRADLVRWLADPRNPLVARVLVNRIWQGHFGRGLVENANDFGTQTAPPVQAELLDWLAAELVARDWSIKAMHRLIMTSAVYRQQPLRRRAGEAPSQAEQHDPDNALYWHYPRRRLSAERIRDGLLAASGRLNSRMEGPGVRPPLPAALGKRDAWKVSESPAEHDRRSVYVFAKRNLPFPLLQAFDLPDMHESCPRRSETTIAPQALFLLNSDDVLDYAASFAARLKGDNPGANDAELVARAYLVAFGRRPNQAELDEALAFLESRRGAGDGATEAVATKSTAADGTAAEGGGSIDPGAGDRALHDFCHALLNANEFLFTE